MLLVFLVSAGNLAWMFPPGVVMALDSPWSRKATHRSA